MKTAIGLTALGLLLLVLLSGWMQQVRDIVPHYTLHVPCCA